MLLLVLNISLGGAISLLLASLGNLLHIRPLKALALQTILVAYFISAWAIASGRVFDTRQVFSSIGQRLLAVAAACLAGFVVFRFLAGHFGLPVDLLFALAATCSSGFWFDRKTRAWLGTGG